MLDKKNAPDRRALASRMSNLTSSAIFRRSDRVLLALAILSSSALIVANTLCARGPLVISDQFDPALQSIRSVDAAVAYVEGTRSSTQPDATADATDVFVRKRFVHGYSELSPCEDWIAYLAGFVRRDLRNPVLPDDILQHRRAACSQQAMVFQAIARKLGMDVASVRLTGHFVPAVRIRGQWIVYDPNQEIKPNSYPLSALLAGDRKIERSYGRIGRTIGMARQAGMGQIHFGDVNSNPAPKASVFHLLTHFLSHYGWAVFLGLFAMNALRALADRRPTKLHQQPARGLD